MAVGTKNRVIKGCGAHHIAVHTRDWEDSLRLYRDVLGMEIVAEFGATRPQDSLAGYGGWKSHGAFPTDCGWTQTGGSRAEQPGAPLCIDDN